MIQQRKRGCRKNYGSPCVCFVQFLTFYQSAVRSDFCRPVVTVLCFASSDRSDALCLCLSCYCSVLCFLQSVGCVMPLSQLLLSLRLPSQLPLLLLRQGKPYQSAHISLPVHRRYRLLSAVPETHLRCREALHFQA